MSIKIPGLKTKSRITRDTGGKVRRYKAPTRANLLKKFKSLKKGTKVADFDPKLKPVLMKNVLDNKKIT
jgi:hypothetical protein|tara:strand:- start:47 stop:253 length:207 start_codon:yes stop_codon:yes gene_type:complete